MGYAFTAFVLALSAMTRAAMTWPSRCPPLHGTFLIQNHGLYPENGDWDPVGCKLYLSSLFNVSVLAYDPYSGQHEILDFDGLTGNNTYHLGGVDYDPYSRSLHFMANAAPAFETLGGDLSGPNKIIRYDPHEKKVVFNADLNAFQEYILNATGTYPGGPQDMASDAAGNTYVPFSFGITAIAKVSPRGEVTPYYFNTDAVTSSSTSGTFVYGGLVFYPPMGKLILANSEWGALTTFDTKATFPSQVKVEISNWPSDYKALQCDGVLNPARYNYKVILCSEDNLNATTIFTSLDGWATAKYIGRVNNTVAGSTPVATVQITDSIFTVEEFFSDTGVFGTPGNRSEFPILDITSDIDALVSAEGLRNCRS